MVRKESTARYYFLQMYVFYLYKELLLIHTFPENNSTVTYVVYGVIIDIYITYM